MFDPLSVKKYFLQKKKKESMSEKLAKDGVSSRGPSINAFATSVKEAVTTSVQTAMNAAHSKAVAQEARNAGQNTIKGIQGSLNHLRQGTKQSSGVRKVPVVLTSNSFTEEATENVDAAVAIAERTHRKSINLLLDRTTVIDKVRVMAADDTMILNTVWHKLMSPADARSRKSSECLPSDD